MPVPDNITLNPGTGGPAMRALSDGTNPWETAVIAYATALSPSANVLQVVTPSNPLPVTGTFWQTTQPVSGTFWQATQPVSGTVTVNAGTNLNTSLLALESGGHLASVDTKTPALGQALAASSVPVVLPAAQITALTPLSTVAVTGTFWQATQPVSGTVTASAITNALPAGANLLGSVAVGQQVANVFNGVTAVTPQYAPITVSTSGPTTIVAGVAGKRIYILRYRLSANGNVNVNWQSHTTTATATGLDYLTQFARGGGAWCPAGIFATAIGEALDLNLSAAVAVGGELTFVVF